MLSIRCFKCGWAWSMNSADVAAALDSMQAEQHTKYYMAECPKCRRANKIPLKQLRRYTPRDWTPTPVKEKPTPAAEKQVESKTETKGKSAAKTEATSKSKAKTTSSSKPKSKTTAKKKTGK